MDLASYLFAVADSPTLGSYQCLYFFQAFHVIIRSCDIVCTILWALLGVDRYSDHYGPECFIFHNEISIR